MEVFEILHFPFVKHLRSVDFFDFEFFLIFNNNGLNPANLLGCFMIELPVFISTLRVLGRFEFLHELFSKLLANLVKDIFFAFNIFLILIILQVFVSLLIPVDELVKSAHALESLPFVLIDLETESVLHII